MENWEFLLQRKGDKSWLPLESPTVEILEGPYRLAARSGLANNLIGIAIAYQPLADVRHQPIQQKIVKRVSHDGLLIVMPYTSFVPGLWQIDCLAAESEAGQESANGSPAWKKTVKFDVIPVSSEAGADWQYNDLESEDLETFPETETAEDIPTNALGIAPTEPVPLTYSSPILDIAEQRSTELVQSMFEEFALFNEDEEFTDAEPTPEKELLGDRPNLLENLEDLELAIASKAENTENDVPDAQMQPRILLRLQQPQYIVGEDDAFDLTGEIYTQGEIEITLKDPQNLNVIFNQRFKVAKSNERHPITGAISFAYRIIVPPPSEVQVLIGEVQIHPQKDFQQYSDLFITQQAIAVSYPASRLLPQLIKEAQKYDAESSPDLALNSSQISPPSGNESIHTESFPQSPQSFPQVLEPNPNPSHALPKTPILSLPPLPSKHPQTVNEKAPQTRFPQNPLSLPPLPPPKNQAVFQAKLGVDLPISEDNLQGFPQADISELSEPQRMELELSLTTSAPTAEPELIYSFEEELPNNYKELLEQPRLENAQAHRKSLHNQGTGNRHNRFLDKLQTLSAEAIANQKANQRTEDLLLDTFPPNQHQSDLSASLDLDDLNQPVRTIAEANSLAELDLELDVQLDRLLTAEPDQILNEYVWEEAIDPNTFPISDISTSNLSATAQTIRNLQESAPQNLSEQEPIPVPEIIISAKEVISGTPMLITVRLPALTAKFFVKFWIKDLQTRTIVDGPRWLLDFSIVPNTNFIETRTNISIPLSSIDVAFEAIAIEAQTQRESHKVTVTRAVIPPNLAHEMIFDD